MIREPIKRGVKTVLSLGGYSIIKLDELTRLADKFGSDKGTLFDAHGYTRIYEPFFARMRGKELTFVEIGLHRSEADHRRSFNAAEGGTIAVAQRAPSLEMWRSYFPRANLYGFDIDDFTTVNIERCTIVRGDMSSHKDLEHFIDVVENPIDILIEDASHSSHHQQIALATLFPYIRSGGFYMIEDLHWQQEDLEREDAPKTRDLLRRLQVLGVISSPYMSLAQSTYLEQNIDEVFLFDSITKESRDPSDALAILVKK
jgi:hypothetical protein